MACAGLLAAFPPVLTWVNHVNNLVGTRGYGGGDGFVEHGAVVKHVSEFVEFPADTDFGSVKVTFPLFDKRAPCVLSDFILDIAARHPHVPCFQIRLPFAEYDHLTKVLDKEITTTVNKTQKLWVAPLHGAVQFSVQKPKLAIFKRDNGAPKNVNACSNCAMFAQQIVRSGCRFTLFTAASHKLGSKTFLVQQHQRNTPPGLF